MLKTLEFKFRVSFRTHTLLDKSLRILQLHTRLYTSTANG